MQAEVGRLGKQREDLAREIRAAEREALSARDGLSTVQSELREASAELDLTRSRITALQECATATMLQIVDSPQSYFHSMLAQEIELSFEGYAMQLIEMRHPARLPRHVSMSLAWRAMLPLDVLSP